MLYEVITPHLAGFVVKEYHEIPSNWRSRMTLDAYLKENGIVGIQPAP